MIKIIDNKGFLVIEKALYNVKEGVRRGLLSVAPMIVRDVVRRIKSPPKTGRLYRIGGTLHQASAPGESPADLTGELAEKVGSDVPSFDKMIIGDGADHGKWMEEGTDDGRIEPRPHLKPAVLSMEREIVQEIRNGVHKELGKT